MSIEAYFFFFKKESFVSETMIAIKMKKNPITEKTESPSPAQITANIMLKIDSSPSIIAAVEEGV